MSRKELLFLEKKVKKSLTDFFSIVQRDTFPGVSGEEKGGSEPSLFNIRFSAPTCMNPSAEINFPLWKKFLIFQGFESLLIFFHYTSPGTVFCFTRVLTLLKFN